MWFAILCICVTLAIVRISHWFYTWANPKCNGKLPPGSMGLPIVGETLEFFKPYAFNDIPPFIKKRMKRYGSIFRTNIVGQNIIVSTDHEINHSIFNQGNKSFLLWYTESFIQIMGRKSLVVVHGSLHKYLRSLILNLVTPEKLKGIIHEMDESVRRQLHTWLNVDIIDVRERTADMVFDYFAKKLISYEESNTKKYKLRNNFHAFIKGLVSFPLNIPGTAYNASVKGRNNIIKHIKEIIEERKTTKVPRNNDFLDHLLEEAGKKDSLLDEEMIQDLILVLLFGGHETTSVAMTIAVKFLADHPQVLAELTKEHKSIIEKRESKDTTIPWTEYKSMTFTHMVINELVRLTNIVPGIYRKAVEDVEINGYVIPKGWFVMVIPSVVHLDGNKYENPLEFNPWRWKDKDLHAGSKTFMAFGGGARLCAGADLAKVQLSIFLHYLVTQYRWSIVKGGNIVRIPGLVFPNGLHAEITQKSA